MWPTEATAMTSTRPSIRVLKRSVMERNDCDTEVDEGLLVSGYIDADGDGYGADESMIDACGTLRALR